MFPARGTHARAMPRGASAERLVFAAGMGDGPADGDRR
jgi:hypothetical protein